MDTTSKFMDLFENALDSESEKELFTELAMDSQLRGDLKSFVSFNEGIKRHIDTFEPSENVKSRVFKKAGFIIPGTILESSTANAAVATKSSIWGNKAFTGLATGLTTTALTIIIMLSLLDGDGNKVHKSISESNLPIITSLENEIASLKQNQKASKDVIKSGTPEIKYIYIYKEKQNDQKAIVDHHPKRIINNSKGLNSNQKALYHLLRNDYSQKLFNAPNYEPLFAQNDYSNSKFMDMSLELSGSRNWHIPKAKIDPARFDEFNNSGVTLFFNITENLKTGLDIKQETFFTEYISKDEAGNEWEYWQQPNLTTISFVNKYYLYSINELSAFGQIGIGFNKSGYVAKPYLGIEYQAYDNLSFLLGAQYDSFWFQHQNKWFSSSKFSINYGISYQF